MPKFHDTHNEAYDYTKKELTQLGWIVKYPYKLPMVIIIIIKINCE